MCITECQVCITLWIPFARLFQWCNANSKTFICSSFSLLIYQILCEVQKLHFNRRDNLYVWRFVYSIIFFFKPICLTSIRIKYFPLFFDSFIFLSVRQAYQGGGSTWIECATLLSLFLSINYEIRPYCIYAPWLDDLYSYNWNIFRALSFHFFFSLSRKSQSKKKQRRKSVNVNDLLMRTQNTNLKTGKLSKNMNGTGDCESQQSKRQNWKPKIEERKSHSKIPLIKSMAIINTAKYCISMWMDRPKSYC